MHVEGEGGVGVFTEQRRTKPEGKGVLRGVRNIKSLTNTAAQLLHGDTAEPFHCEVNRTLTKQVDEHVLSCWSDNKKQSETKQNPHNFKTDSTF